VKRGWPRPPCGRARPHSGGQRPKGAGRRSKRKFIMENGIILTWCKEFLNAGRWYFVGPPPACGGRRPRAEAAASPQGWPPPKPLSIQKVFDCKWNWYYIPSLPIPFPPISRGERLGVKGDRTPICRALSVPSSWPYTKFSAKGF